MGEDRPRPTQAEVARCAGVTQATVSLALRDHPALPAATRAKVQEVARALGYTPDPELGRLMARLRLRRRHPLRSVLGLVTGFPVRSPWRTMPHVERTYQGVKRRAGELGYQLEEVWLCDPLVPEASQARILRARGIEGLIVLGLPDYRARLELDLAGFVVAAVGYSLGQSVPRASPDQFHDTLLALGALAGRGYRRIAFVLHEPTDFRVQRHFSAAWHVWADAEAGRAALLLRHSGLDRDRFLAFCGRERPDAILVQSPPPTVIEEWLGAPDLAGLAWLDLAGPEGRWAGVRQATEAAGAAAVDLVAAGLQGARAEAEDPPRVVQLPGRWVDGPTARGPGEISGPA